MNTSSLHILYTNTDIEGNMDILNYPAGWQWVGSGPVAPVYTKSCIYYCYSKYCEYRYEEQFVGPMESEKEMVELLESKLSQFQNNGLIKGYKIVVSRG